MQKISKKIILSIAGVVMLLPMLALAFNSGSQPSGTLGSIDSIITNILNIIWPAFIGLSVIMIIISGFLFITSGGDPEKVGKARTAMLWAVVGIVVAIVAYSVPFIVKTAIGG